MVFGRPVRLGDPAAGGAVEERGRDLLARRVPRVGLHDSAACPRDQVQGPLDRHGGHPFMPVACDVYWSDTRCRKAVNEAAVSRRIRGASSRSSGPDPPCTSALFTSRTHPGPASSSRWLKVTVPSGTGHSVTQRRPGSTTVTVKAPPRLPRCLAQPRVPGSNGPSSWATSLLTSHSGQPATSVHTFQTASGSASKTASYSNRCMIVSAGAAHGFAPQPNEPE